MSYVAMAMAEVSTRVRKMLVSAMLRVRWSFYLDNPPATLGYAISGEAGAAAVTYNAAAATVAEGVKCTVALLVATKGEILLDRNLQLSHVKLKDWRRGIGYVPQELTLLHGSISENVTMGDASISQEAVTRALGRAGALALVTDTAARR